MSDVDPKGLQDAAPLGSGEAGEHRATEEEANGAPGGADIHAYIGTRLREVYDDVANQPVPDRFLELMRQLDGK